MLPFKQKCQLLLVGFVIILSFSVTAQPQIFEKPLSPRIANYDIDVKLDVKKRMIFGKEKLTWYNKTSTQVSELQFHLYLNGFRNTKSTLIEEFGGWFKGNRVEDDGWGYIEVSRITDVRGKDLTQQIEFIQPDDDNTYDKTVFRLPLSSALSPGKSIVLNIDFFAKLPQPPMQRSGARDEYFFVGQWFPKVGVFANGEWNCHQYHRNSEFFADFGVYNVKINVPENNIVGATGIENGVENKSDSTKTHFYHAEDVHDFAWTTSPDFVEFKENANGIDIRLLLQKDHKKQAKRHLAAAKVALKYFHNWYGEYPYPNLTIVDPRRGASGSGGMEYPTLITTGTFYGMPKGLRMVEAVVIHEFGHNYWYHMVASNEFEEAWLDEGINTFSEQQIMDDFYGRSTGMIDLLGLKMGNAQMNRGQYIFFPDLDPVVLNSWDFYSSASYAISSYFKPALMLETLQNYIGKETMQKILRAYFEKWKFKHPKTEDFVAIANEVSGQDLNWFFDQMLYTQKKLDYSVTRVFTRKIKQEKGYDITLSVNDGSSDFNEDNKSNQSPDSLEGIEIVETDSTDSSEEKSDMFYSGVNIRNLGDFVFPVEIEFVFANGDTILEEWDGKSRWKKYRFTKDAKLVSAEIDPARKIPIDLNFTNNSKRIEKKSKGVNKLSTRFLFWVQAFLEQPDILNMFSIIGNLN